MAQFPPGGIDLDTAQVLPADLGWDFPVYAVISDYRSRRYCLCTQFGWMHCKERGT